MVLPASLVFGFFFLALTGVDAIFLALGLGFEDLARFLTTRFVFLPEVLLREICFLVEVFTVRF